MFSSLLDDEQEVLKKLQTLQYAVGDVPLYNLAKQQDTWAATLGPPLQTSDFGGALTRILLQDLIPLG